MNFVNQALEQLNALLRSMTVGARITSVLLMTIVVVSLVYLFNYQMTGGEDYLLGGESFSADEISEMEAAWGKAGLTSYRRDGARIHVPRAQRAAYMGALADAGALPEAWGAYLEKMSADANPLASPRDLEQKRKIFVQLQLKQVLEQMDGVQQAMVLIDSETRPGLRAEKRCTASVTVFPKANLPITEETAEVIRQMVASSVAGLTTDRVAVTDTRFNRSFTSSPTDTPGGQSDTVLSAKRSYQEDYSQRIRGALESVPGAIVAVNVEMSGELQFEEKKTEIDAKDAVVIQSEKETNRTVSAAGGGGGRPGLEAQNAGAGNQPANLAKASAPPTNEEDRTSNVQQSVVPHGETHTVKTGLVPQRVTVSVSVPSSYFRKVWEGRNLPVAGTQPKQPTAQDLAAVEQEQLKNIRDHVLNQIPRPQGVDPAELIQVTAFQDLPVIETAVAPFSDNAMTWLAQSWGTLGLFGLAAFSLLVLRSTVRAAPASTPPSFAVDSNPAGETASSRGSAEAREAALAAGETVEITPAGPRLKRRRLSGPTLRDDLVDIVREDPDAAAKILKGWIGTPT